MSMDDTYFPKACILNKAQLSKTAGREREQLVNNQIFQTIQGAVTTYSYITNHS
jgi:hypothetical protein